MTDRPRVLLAYSGGLDTSWLVAWLTRERGMAVTTLTVDCGGLDDAERADLARRAREFGAVEHRLVDARERLFERVVRHLIAGNVRRGGTYPLSVAAERGLQAEVLAEVARAEGFEAVAHGCTGAGNDQVRFEAALAIVSEGLEVLAPVRDLAPSRADECAWLERHGLPLPPSSGGGRYSVNAGLWGLTIGGGETLTAAGALPEAAWQWTRGGGGAATLALRFERGVPVGYALHVPKASGAASAARAGSAAGSSSAASTADSSSSGAAELRELAPVALVERLNREVGALGVGRGYHLGDTVLGIKGRIGFEAPAAEVILTAHRELEKLVLTEDQRFWKDHLGDVYGRKLHQGLLHDPFLRDVEAFLASSQERVSGTVTLALAGGRALVVGLESPFDMMAASDARYGERPSAKADPKGALWLARTLAEPARLARRAGERSGVVAEEVVA